MNGVRRAPAPSGDLPGRGYFIVLEGIDGAGKTEQVRRLAAWLRDCGESVVETREPTDGPWGQRYRAWARGEFEADRDQVLKFFVEDRREHVAGVIRPALERGDVVLCDRYIASTLAYQAAQDIDREAVLESMSGADFPAPDLTLWLRLPVEHALARLDPAGRERFERQAFLERVDAEYSRLPLREVDASGRVDEVEDLIRAQIEALLSGVPESPPPRPVHPPDFTTRLVRALNPLVTFLLRSSLHALVSSDILLLSFVGRKTGRRFTTPISYIEHDGCLYGFTHSPWWKNLRGGASVRVCLRGEEQEAKGTAVVADTDRIAALLGEFLRRVPRDARFYDVALERGEPNPEDLERAAHEIVMLEIELLPTP